MKCSVEYSVQLLECLKQKSMLQLVIGLNQMISSGNFSATFAPVDDHLYLGGQTNFFHESPKFALEKGHFKKVKNKMKKLKKKIAYLGNPALFHVFL